ncbi:MAG: ornithine cyclodeaminase family protein [Chloroflexi bacterium]|nr:ornithine cyclodeaminase family protein [Chloroflexota bacterium]
MTLIISSDELRELLTMEDDIAALERAHVEFSRGQVLMPVRSRLAYPERRGGLGMMPAILKDTDTMGIKVQCSFQDNPASGLPLIMGLVLLYDPHTGEPLAVMDSAYITAVRTAAASAMATKYLARPDAHVLAILGAGLQGRTHLWAMKTVRPVERVQVYSRTRESCERYKAEMEAKHGLAVAICDTPEQAVRGADLICTTSVSRTPIVEGKWVQPGAHINGVGSYSLDTREIDSDAVAMAKVVVDSRDAVLKECGDIMIPVQEGRITIDHLVGEIGEVIAGAKPGRTSAEEVTIYKSLGVGIQDVATAHMVYHKALKLGMGTQIRM